MQIPIDILDPDPGQPRTIFDDATIESLASSMAATGQVVAIMVRPVGDRYVIVHGERRYRAARLLGWRELRAEVGDVAAEDVPWLALVENVQRQDLTPVEEAKAYQRMVEAGFTQSEVGRRVGKTQSYVAQKLRLLKLPATIQDLLTARTITEGHARQLLRLDYAADASIERAADKAVAGQWSVKRLKLEVDFQQMTHDGYRLLPIDDRLKFQDLVDLEKVPFDDNGDAHLRVQRHLGMILDLTQELWDIGGNELARWLIKDAPLFDVYVFLAWHRSWKPLERHISLGSWLRANFAFNHFDEARSRFFSTVATMLDDPDEDTITATCVGYANEMDRDFGRLYQATYVT